MNKVIFNLFILKTLFLLGLQISAFSQKIVHDVMLINIENIDRGCIAEVVSTINQYNPKVIAMDIIFIHKNDEDNMKLSYVLKNCKNLVLPSSIAGFNIIEDSLFSSFVNKTDSQFLTNAKTGFVDVLLEDFNIFFIEIKRFSAFEKVGSKLEYHFSIATAMAFDSIKAYDFINNNPKINEVEYGEYKRDFKTFNSREVLNGTLKEADISGKIIMIGFLGPGDEDLFFLPQRYRSTYGKDQIYGLEYLAHVVCQVLKFH